MKTTLFLMSAALIAGSSLAQALWLAPPPASRTVVQTTTHYAEPAYHAPPARGYRAPMPTDEFGFYTEAAGFFGFGTTDVMEYIPEFGSMDIVGIDFNVGHRFNRFHAVNLRIGYGYGSGDVAYFIGRNYGYLDVSMHTFTLMPGYRFTFGPRNSPLEFFAGVNAGLAVVGITMDEEYYKHGSRGQYYDYDGTEAGFAFSAEVGVKYHYSPRGYIFASYEFRGSTASPTAEWSHDSSYNYKTEAQFYHTIRFGGGIEF